MSATTLSVGQVGIIEVNTEDTGSPNLDAIQFVLLAPIGSGTQIFITDRSWNGSSFTSAAGDGTFTYTAPSDLAAGTVITITQAQLTGAGMSLADTGETIYMYQGANANSPTTFLHALDIADGNTTFNGNLTNTGLVNGVSAVAIGNDNMQFGTRLDNIQASDAFAQINSNTDWVQNDNSPQANISGPVTTAPDSQIWVAGSGAGEAIVTINLDGSYSSGSVGYQIVQAFQNDANLFHPSDITLDTVHDRFFFVDSDISGGHNRIIQGSISQLLNNPGQAFAFTVLYSDTGTTAASSMRTLSVDTVNKIIYFDHGTTFNKIGYDAANQTPTVLANLGSNNYITQATIDYVHGEVYLGSSRITSVFGSDVISKNYIYRATGLTSGSSTLSFSQLPFNPDDSGLGPEGSPLGGEAWPVERGNIRGIDVDPVNHDLYIVTGSVTLDNDGNGATTYPGGIWKYDLDSNSTGTVTNLYTSGTGGPAGLLYYIEVDPATNRYYVIDETGGAAVDDGGVWTGSLSGAAIPTLVSYVGNINGLGPQGLEIQHAPTLSSSFALTPTYTETPGADSPNGTPIQLANSFNSTDADSGTAAVDQLAGAQVRISSGFQSGTEHQDVLTINGNTSGTIELGAQDISYSYNSATGVMTLTGIQTLDNYEAALALVRLRVDGDNPTNYGNNGSRVVSFSTFDGLLYSDEQSITVTVTGVNDAPINTVTGAQSINEDATRVFSTGNANALSVSDVDADPANQALQVTLSIANGHGTLTLGSLTGLVFSVGDGTGDATMTFTGTANAINQALAIGTLTFIPTADYNGAATLTFTVSDQGFNGTGGAQTDSDTVTINIAAVADITNDTATTNEDTAASILVQNNDTFENAGHQITAITQGAHGTVSINDNGTAANFADDYLVYTPNADYNGTDSFTYTISSGGGVDETATVNVTINAVADIVGDSVTVNEDSGSNTLNLLANDTFESAGRSITAVGTASHGTVAIDNNGTAGDTTDDFVAYTPSADYNGSDSFTYTVTSGGVTETATVNVTVSAVADIVDDNVTVDEDSGSNTLDLLANDSFESSGRAITAVGAAGHGTVAINNNGTPGDATDDFVTYTPDADFNGSDSFTYTVTSAGTTEMATVNVTVNSVNDAPTSTNLDGDSVTWTEGSAAVLLDSGSDATVSDIDSPNFDTGTLTVGITANGVSGEDVLGIQNQGTGAGQIGVSGTDVSYGGTTIGTFTGGSAGADLVITFNSSADQAAVAALLHNIQYNNTGGDNPTDGDRTVTWTLVDGDGTALGGNDTLTVTTTVNVNPVDDAPVAQNDAVTTAANALLNGDVFADNGSGPDSDPDGPALQVSAVNGSAGDVDTQIALSSNALLTQNTDGSFSYDPNGQFDYLISAATGTATGAVNTSATDTWNYDLAGGNNAVVTVTINGVDGAGDQLWGDAGVNSITGTGAADFINLSQGGNDTADGGLGDDGIYMGAAFSAADHLAGGGGFDQVGLQGNYGSAGSPVVFDSATLSTTEMLVLLSGSDTRFGDIAGNSYSYYLTTHDDNVAVGQTLYVSANTLGVGEDLVFDGSAETDGKFFTYGGLGNDTITGGQQTDGFYFGYGRWGAGDSVDGQGGALDQLGLQGIYTAAGTGAVVFGAGQLTGIEMLVCLTGGDNRFGAPPGVGYSYDITTNDGNVAAGQTLYVSANTLQAAGGTLTADETLTFNGSAETNGSFTVYSGAGADHIIGGAGDDTIFGGAGNDVITGGLGADALHGGAGNDAFLYTATSDSTSVSQDQIFDFATGDQIDLSAIDAGPGAGDDAFSFIGSGAFSNTAGELRAFEQTTDHWVIEGDTDGNGVADLVIAVTVSDSHSLAAGDFVL